MTLPESDPDALVAEVSSHVTGLEPDEGGGMVDEAADQVIAFLEGELREFELDLDWQLIGGFHREVLKATTRIPWGETASYGEVAALAGRPGAARAAGTALSKNPIALIVPCHRIIKCRDGTTGGRSEGTGRNRPSNNASSDLERPSGERRKVALRSARRGTGGRGGTRSRRPVQTVRLRYSRMKPSMSPSRTFWASPTS